MTITAKRKTRHKPRSKSAVPKIGSVRKDGKVYAGGDYGYQSRASFNKLKKEGQLLRGAGLVRRIQKIAGQIEEARSKRFGNLDEKSLLGKLNKELTNLYDQSSLGVADEQAAKIGGDIAKRVGFTPVLGAALLGTVVPGPGEGKQVAKGLSGAARKAPDVPKVQGPKPHPKANVPIRDNLGDIRQAPKPDNYNPVTRRVEPRPRPENIGADPTELREYAAREARRAARDPVAMQRAEAAGNATAAAQANERAVRARKAAASDKDLRRPVKYPIAKVDQEANRLRRAQRRNRTNPNQPARITRSRGGVVSNDPRPEVKVERRKGRVSDSLTESRRQRNRQQQARLQRAQQRIRTEGAVRKANRPLTPQERANMRRFNQQQVVDQYHPDGPRMRRHNADDTVREYNEGRAGASQSDRAFSEGGDYQGDRYQDTGGFDARYDREGNVNDTNPGFSVQSTDVTGQGMGRRGASGAIRGTFDIEKVKKDLKKAGIDPRKDPEAAKKFFRENYPTQVYGPDAEGVTRSVMRPGSKPGSEPGKVKTSSTLNDKVSDHLMRRRFPDQFNQLEAERAPGARLTRAERRDRARRRDGKPRYSDRYRVEGGEELPTRGAVSKPAANRKSLENIPGGRRIPRSEVEQRRVDRAKERIRKSSQADGSVDWKQGTNNRQRMQLPKQNRRYRSDAQPNDRRTRAAQEQERRRRSAERIRDQFQVTKTVDKPDGSYEVVPSVEQPALRFNSGQARMESRRTGRSKDKPKGERGTVNREVRRDTKARRAGFEERFVETDPQQTGGKRGDSVAYERETRTIAESVKPERGARSALQRAQRREARAGIPGDRRNTSQHRRGGTRQPVGGAKAGAGGTKPARRRTVRAIPKDKRNAKLTPDQQRKMDELKLRDDPNNEFYPSGRLRNTSETNYPRGGRKNSPTAEEQTFVRSGRKASRDREAHKIDVEAANQKPRLNKNGSVNKTDQKRILKAKQRLAGRQKEMERIRKERLERRQRRVNRRRGSGQ